MLLRVMLSALIIAFGGLAFALRRVAKGRVPLCDPDAPVAVPLIITVGLGAILAGLILTAFLAVCSPLGSAGVCFEIAKSPPWTAITAAVATPLLDASRSRGAQVHPGRAAKYRRMS